MTENPFRKFYDAGYHRLVPIVPPGSLISIKSSLAKRPKAVGKAPGVKRPDGTWQGFNWLPHVTSEADLNDWHAMGAGVGIRTGAGLVAVDIDTLDEQLADECQALAELNLGETSIRIGRWPKRLMLYRVTDVTPYQRVLFDDGFEYPKGAEARVELLSDDRQFVAHGVHPGTGAPYSWPDGLLNYDALPLVTPADLNAFFELLLQRLPKAARHVESAAAAATNVDQRQLLGDPDTVARAVAALPNTSALFPTYDDYVRVGYAIKGATQDDAAGLELFQEWAARWTDGDNDPDVVSADWRRMKPPYQVGAQYLYALAEQHGGGQFRAAETWFDGSGAGSASPFDSAPQAPEKPELDPIRWRDPAEWDGEETPPREWEVEGWIPRRQVTLLYGEGGIGKTLLIHQYAVCAAAGRDWLGQKTRQARVMAVFCEDDDDELHRRHKAILSHLGLTSLDLGGRFRMVSRTGEDNLLAVVNRASGKVVPTPFWHQVRADAVAWGADVVVVDTIADTFGGSEIDRGQVNTFVKMILGGLAKAVGGSTVALGHPSVAGRGEGRSGSTAWSNAARSRIYLRYPDDKKKGAVRELEGAKSNYGPAGNLLRLKWSRGAFEMTGESKPEIDLNALKGAVESWGGSGEAVASREAGGALGVSGAASGRAPSLEAQEARAVLAALAAAQVDRRALNLSPRSGAYAPKILKREYAEHVGDVRQGEVEGIISDLIRRGAVRPVEWTGSSRNKVAGYEVVTADHAGVGVRVGVFG